MDDFRFRGRHIREFGAVAAFGESMRYGGKVMRGEYGLPGGGSVLIGEDEWQPTQRSVMITPEDGVEASPAWRRRIVSWLQGGRGEMIVDNDPDVILIASFDADGTYDYKTWPLGCLTLQMTLQPLAYAAIETQCLRHVTAQEAGVLGLDMESALDVPLRVLVKATSGTITRVQLEAGSACLNLPNLSLAAGQLLEYDAGQFLGDPATLMVDGAVDFSPAQGGSWARLVLDPAADVLRVTLEGGEADVTVSARGRWPA